MSLVDLLLEVVNVLIIAGVFFIAYRALKLRSVLVDRPYRTRALWTAIGASSVFGFISAGVLDGIFGQNPTTVVGVLVEAVAWGFVFLALYGWMATNIDVAIAADYFNRDALSWRRGGRVIAICVIIVSYTLASLPSWWVPQVQISSGLGTTVITLLFLAVAVYSALALAITITRIVDRRIRTYTKWVVLSVVLLFVSIFTIGSGDWTGLVGLAAAVGWLYGMNHTVTTLAIRTKTLPT